MALDFKDEQLGTVLSKVVAVLVLCIIYLVILLPFSSNDSIIGSAIGVLATLVGTIISVRAWRSR